MNRITNISFTFLGNISIAISKWLILILIVRLTNVEEVGKYTFAIAFSTPILLFANMRLRLRYVVEDDLNFNIVQKLRRNVSIIIFIFLSFLSFFYDKTIFVYVMLVSLTRILELQSDLYYAIYHKISEFKTIGKLQLGRSLTNILSFTFIILITSDVKYAIMAQIISHLLWLFLKERKSLCFLNENEFNKVAKNTLLSVFIVGLPLAIVQVINSYNILIPRYFIEGLLSIELVGIFASISYLLSVIDLFMNAISQNIIVDIKRFIDNKKFNKIKSIITKESFKISLTLLIVIPIMTYLVSEKIILLLYGNEYSKYYLILVIVSISIPFNFLSWIYDTTLMAFNVYKIQLLTSIITLIISLISSYYLIYNFEIYGAALAVLLICVAQSIMKLVVILIVIERKV